MTLSLLVCVCLCVDNVQKWVFTVKVIKKYVSHRRELILKLSLSAQSALSFPDHPFIKCVGVTKKWCCSFYDDCLWHYCRIIQQCFPLLQCPEGHIICSQCRPKVFKSTISTFTFQIWPFSNPWRLVPCSIRTLKVSRCPVCRFVFHGTPDIRCVGSSYKINDNLHYDTAPLM